MSDTIASIASEIHDCTKCRLHEGRTNTVPGYGNPQAKIVFVGEGPGKDEDLQGRPFVGRSGQLLTKLLAGIGIDREDVFITNVVKCRPPNNRDPMEDEIGTCVPAYLERQIQAINPRVIVTLGRFSLGIFLPGVSISQAHGQAKRRVSDKRVIFPFYHPAVGLYKASMVATLEQDMQVLKALLAKLEQSPLDAQ